MMLPRTATWTGYDKKRAATDAAFLEGLSLAKQGHFKKAFHKFQISHRNGNLDATYTLGTWHREGWLGKLSSTVSAFRYYKQAAVLSHKLGIFGLALSYSDGIGVKQSKENALRWYETGGGKGDVHCMYNAAIIHLNKDQIIKARAWLKKASDLHYKPANTLLMKIDQES